MLTSWETEWKPQTSGSVEAKNSKWPYQR